MNRRAIIAAASAAFFSSACGGGSDAKTIAFYGDSLSYGNVPDGRLPVTPAQRLAELTGYEVRDLTAGGDTLPLAFGDGRFPIKARSDVVLMRFGGADYLLGTELGRFQSLYSEAVRSAQGLGCTVVLAGLYEHPEFPDLNAFDAAASRVAADCGAVWVDLRRLVPVSHPGDFADNLHGTQQTSDRWMSACAEAIKRTGA